ncbi:MAG TPA: PKD domain-containing protein [Solirubrobacterales bacterium]|nr:PKD domain-containing protein [Solirubrobacterales bacterium]
MSGTGRTLRRSGAVAAIVAALVAFAGLACASAGAAPLVWTASPSAESVSTIDSGTGKLVGSPIPLAKPIQGEWQPLSIALSPDGRWAVVTEVESPGAVVIDTASRKVVGGFGPPGVSGEKVAISPDGKSAWVTLQGDERVLSFNPQSPGVGQTTRIGAAGSAIAVTPDGEYAYVGVAPDEIKTIYAPSREVVGKPIAVGGISSSIVFTPNGKTAYVAVEGVKGVQVIDTALEEVVKTIPTTAEPSSLAVSPDGKRLYIATEGPVASATISTAETATDTIVGKSIGVPSGAAEIAVAPDGKTVWAAGSAVTRITLAGENVETLAGTGETSALVVAPDQSPTAVFTPPGVTLGTPAVFNGSASTDPDGSIASWNWSFGDGGTAGGVAATHAYAAAGAYTTKLSVFDKEGCGEEEVFTGRTAYCSGSAPASHPVSVAPLPAVAPLPPSNKFRVGRILHNRHNGTVRIQVVLPGAGFVLLFGNKVHAVTRKSKAARSMWLTIHARVELNKRLKKVLRAPVRIRLTYTPNGGTARTVHRSVVLQRTPRHKHHKH